MYAQVEKSKENKSRTVANSVAQNKRIGMQGFGFVDNRSESILQRKIQTLVNNSASQLIQENENINNDSVLEKDADVIGTKASKQFKALSQVKRSNISLQSAGSPIVQCYTEQNGLNISKNSRFAVSGNSINSQLYIAEDVKLPDLQHVILERTGEKIKPTDRELERVNATFEDKEEMEKMYCGKFSKAITGISEDVENENAPPGRSLFVNNPSGEFDGVWRNHYAPVIVADDTDRGTLETAVGIDHIWFGIYGKERGHTFRYKTAVASTELLIKMEPGKHEPLLGLLNRYKKEGDACLESISEKERIALTTIAKAIETSLNPIDGKTATQTELTKARETRETREAEEMNRRQKLLIKDIRLNAEGWEERVRNEHYYSLNKLLIATIKECKDEGERDRLNRAIKMTTIGVSSISSSTREDASSSISLTTLFSGAVLVAVLAFIIYALTKSPTK